MPRITKVYTRTGDDGTTSLGAGQRVPKDSLRVEAYAPVSLLGKITVGMEMQVKPEAPVSGAYKATVTVVDPRLNQVRDHLRRYRELASQGKWSEAGKELEAIEGLVRQ